MVEESRGGITDNTGVGYISNFTERVEEEHGSVANDVGRWVDAGWRGRSGSWRGMFGIWSWDDWNYWIGVSSVGDDIFEVIIFDFTGNRGLVWSVAVNRWRINAVFVFGRKFTSIVLGNFVTFLIDVLDVNDVGGWLIESGAAGISDRIIIISYTRNAVHGGVEVDLLVHLTR